MGRVGLVVNPAAGRDIRRLTGGASVVDNYAKRRVAECVVAGMRVVPDPPTLAVMPDRAGIADAAVEAASPDVDVETLDLDVEESAEDTRRAAAQFRESADVVVVLGGDGTTRDAALEAGDVPLLAVSTGTNNVVPTAVDGTVAGAAAALVAAGAVDVDAVTTRHGRVEVYAEDAGREKRLTGLATVEITDRPFVGTRAVVDPSELLGGVVSRAHPGDIGLGGVVGCLAPLAPDAPGGAAIRLADPADADRTVRGIVAPGVTAEFGVTAHRALDWGETETVDCSNCVVGADGERALEIVDAAVEMTPHADGPRLVDVDATLAAAAEAGALVTDRVAPEE
ncbi:MAG: NAD(+)/NADH kinase [Haloplanus sp.]